MKTYTFIVTVHCETEAEAERVMVERLGHDEDYGFLYALEVATHPLAPPPDCAKWAEYAVAMEKHVGRADLETVT